MDLSPNAQQAMQELKAAYVAQGFPPRQEWWFQMPQRLTDELTGAGLIEPVDPDNWTLSNAGHAWVMTKR